MIIDSHCHLDYEPMFSNLNEVVERAKIGVNFMLTISVTDKKYNIILDIINKYSIVQHMEYIHEAKNTTRQPKILSLKIKKIKIIGIGETGLDLLQPSDKNDQVKLFEEHIKASIR